MVWMLLFWGSIVALVVWVVRRLSAGNERPRLQSPLDIAKERYARGEIDRQEFERLRQDLS
jgi:putative membrane protein